MKEKRKLILDGNNWFILEKDRVIEIGIVELIDDVLTQTIFMNILIQKKI